MRPGRPGRTGRRSFFAAAALLFWAALFFLPLPAPGAEPPPVSLAGDDLKEIVVGLPTSLTYLEGAESAQAALLAVEEINAKGGVDLGGRRLPLRLITVDLDDAGPGVSGREAAERLEKFLEAHRVQALVTGPFRSEALLECLPVIVRCRVPLLGAIAMTPASEELVMTRPEYRYVFRVGLDARYLVEYLASAMDLLGQRFGCRKVMILNQDVAWARATASLMIRLYFQPRGWEVLGQENFPAGFTDFDPALELARERGAEVILPIFDTPQSGYLAERWSSRRVPAFLCGFISPLAGPGAWRTFGDRITGALNLAFELGNIPSPRYPPSEAFHQAFRRRFGRDVEAGHGPAPTYEAVYILAEALERAGTAEPDRLALALEKTSRRGAMGRVVFHRGGQAVFGTDPEREALGCLVQWRPGGRRVLVYPASVATGEVQPPPWMNPPPLP